MSFKDFIRPMTIDDLLIERTKWQTVANEPDSRLIACNGSYWIDYALDNINDINDVLKEKGFNHPINVD